MGNHISNMKAKTSHEFARELLAGPDLPIYHFDPSCAGCDSENDTSISEPIIEKVDSEKYEDAETGEQKVSDEFLTIVGKQHEEHGLAEEQ